MVAPGTDQGTACTESVALSLVHHKLPKMQSTSGQVVFQTRSRAAECAMLACAKQPLLGSGPAAGTDFQLIAAPTDTATPKTGRTCPIGPPPLGFSTDLPVVGETRAAAADLWFLTFHALGSNNCQPLLIAVDTAICNFALRIQHISSAIALPVDSRSGFSSP